MHPGTSLTDAVRCWPTPHAEDSEASGYRHNRQTADTLTAAVRGCRQMWPTPQAYAALEGMGKPIDTAVRGQGGQVGPANHNAAGSRRASSVVLNPAWVSCLMGFPPDWCDIGDAPLPRSGMR